MISLNSVTFESTDLKYKGEQEGVRFWSTTVGDSVSLHYFPIPPDIEANLELIDEVRNFYRKTTQERGYAIIEVEVTTFNECLAIRLIVKIPQQPRGMTYVGSLTLPFRDFSYVVKVQCPERGITGIRDSIVYQMLKTDKFPVDEQGWLEGWMQDPYEPTLNCSFARNLSEDKKYDKMFPDHPLSRLREKLQQLQDTLEIAAEVKMKPRFKQ